MMPDRCGGCARPITASPCPFCRWSPPPPDRVIAGALALIAALVSTGVLVMVLGH